MAKDKKIKLDIYTDGACSGNPGKGGWAFCVTNGKDLLKKSFGGVRETTNNRMELMAIAQALISVDKKIDNEDNVNIRIFSDSAYCINGFNKRWVNKWIGNGWKTSNGTDVLNKDLWEKIHSFDKKYNIQFIKVKGHDGDNFNELCDSLAVEAYKNIQ